MKKLFFFLILSTVVLTGCADVSTCVTDQEYGFWNGLWHGTIMGFSLIGSLISDEIAMYAVNNNGGWYNLGFFLGTVGFLTTLTKIVIAILVEIAEVLNLK